MAQSIQTWRPQADSPTLWQILSGGGPKPSGDGWSISGYELGQVSFGKGTQNVRVPVYQRVVGEAPAPAAAAAAPEPAPQPKVVAKDPEPISNDPYKSQYEDQINSILKELANLSRAQAPSQVSLSIPDPGVSSSTQIAGNATGFTRAQSAARKAGLISKGSSRLRIKPTGQTTASSGLNIGV